MRTLRTTTTLILGLSLMIGFSSESFATANPYDTEAYLKAFHANPKQVMNTPLMKLDEKGHQGVGPQSPLEINGLTPDEAVQARSTVRDQICKAANQSCDSQRSDEIHASFFWGINQDNQMTSFLFEPTYLTKLSEMEDQSLLAGQAPRAPWSDSFWPAQKGITARRWLDKGFPDTRNFIDNYNYYLSSPATSIDVNTLSPAEKYDTLVGDASYRLTNANWAEGKGSWDKRGMVPGWVGICHGWSPAAILTPAPKKSVTVQSPSGQAITFYPSDIKALISLAYAASPPKTFKIGQRCNKTHPAEDDMGRVIDPTCFDVNPGAWHMAVVNEMGVHKRSFVVDTNYDLQIWNYPLYSYHYQYFNPQTFATSNTLGGAAVKIENFTIDKFKKYRGADAKYVVGIAMEIAYSVETSPSIKPYQRPRLTTEKILYDLELDEKGAIIGGEWYSNFHPAFIWHFQPDARPLSVGELNMAAPVSWDGGGPVPEALRQVATESSLAEEPLAAVVEELVKLSQDVDPNTPLP